MTLGRGFMTGISAIGVLAGIIGYAGSFQGLTLRQEGFWVAGLVIGAVIVNVPIREFWLRWSDRTFFWKGLWRGSPPWVGKSVRLCYAIALLQFFILAFRTHLANPVELDVEYVLRTHGQVVKVLTSNEFMALKAEELRTYAAFDISVYFVPLMYWWLKRPSADQPTSAHP